MARVGSKSGSAVRVSGRQVGVRASAYPIGKGVVAQGGFKLGEARQFYGKMLHTYRQLSPSTLGGELTRTRMQAIHPRHPAGKQAVGALANRAVARTISENRARRAATKKGRNRRSK